MTAIESEATVQTSSARSSAHVLVVDDDGAARRCLEQLLRGSGFVTSAARNGRAALDVAARSDLDVVLTDLQMPTMNGAELCERLRAVDSQLPVVVTTSFGDADAILASLRAGARDYLMKPLDVDEIIACIRRVARGRGRADGARRPSYAPASRSAGRIVGDRYRLIRRLGRGGMSEVWLAEHLSLGSEVALKFLASSCDAESLERRREMFRQEAQLSAQLGVTAHAI